MRIDVIFDTVCPWCYIGKRRLDRALAARPDVVPDIRWRSFLLNPEIPHEGLDRQQYLERKFGSTYRIHRVHGAAMLAGQPEGIAFDFEAMTRTPSSILSHQLIQYAIGSGHQGEVVEAIFRAYFVEGLDIGDVAVLRRVAKSCGLPGNEAADYLRGGTGTVAVQAEHGRMQRLGVSGVPCYIFDERYAISGAQEPDILVRLIDIARESQLEAASS